MSDEDTQRPDGVPIFNMLSDELIQQKIEKMFLVVGDLSSHPIDEKMERLMVTKDEVCWTPPYMEYWDVSSRRVAQAMGIKAAVDILHGNRS